MNVLWENATPHASGYREVTAAAVHDVRDRVKLVDVREPHETSGELGRVEGAELVPLAGVEAAASGWVREVEIVLICRSGNRSGKAAALLMAMGFQRPLNMVGGMLAWNDHKFPVVR